jgi:hypothetical protein
MRIYILPVVHHLEPPLIRKRILKWLKLLEEGIFFNSSDGVVVNSQFIQRSEPLLHSLVVGQSGLRHIEERSGYLDPGLDDPYK